MPIRPENRKRYPKDWKKIRERILHRDGYRCKFCKAPDRDVIVRADGCFMESNGNVRDENTGRRIGRARGSEFAGRSVLVVLTIAHIHDHRPEACEDDNLAALCQQCHNRHDAKMRAHGKKHRKHRQHHNDLFDEAPPLLCAVECKT